MRPIYYDTETTGTRPEKDRVIEMAAFDPSTGKSYSQLINPGSPIPPEATAIHKITDEMVSSAPTFQEMIPSFLSFLGSDAVLIAHNNDTFDKLFLEAEFSRAGATLPPYPFIDSLKWSRKYRPDLPRHSLQFLREVFGIEANQAHRALDDVIVLHKVFSAMIDDLPIETVLELLSNSSQPNRMPFGKHQGKPLSEVPSSYVRWLDESGALSKGENKELRATFAKLGLLK